MVVSLLEMEPGETGVVREIAGGLGITGRVQSMGIRVGEKIKKENAHLWRGPQTVVIGRSKIAIGYGMASKIFIEVDR